MASSEIQKVCNSILYTLQTRAKYLSVGKSMKLFEDTKYEMWKETVEQVLPSLLKRNLLIKPAVSAAMAMHASHVPDDVGDDVGQSALCHQLSVLVLLICVSVFLSL